jgi:hypothetical protein
VNAYLPEPADRPPADQRREPVRGTLIERAKTVANAANGLPKLLILFAGAPEEIELLTPRFVVRGGNGSGSDQFACQMPCELRANKAKLTRQAG